MIVRRPSSLAFAITVRLGSTPNNVVGADAGNYRLRVGEGGLSSIIKTTINNPYDEVKAPAVTILAILASNDSYR
jgi:hypothetical protein